MCPPTNLPHQPRKLPIRILGPNNPGALSLPDARRPEVIKHAAATRRPLPPLFGTAVTSFLTPPLLGQAAGGVIHVGGGLDLDAGLVPCLEPPLLGTVTRRTTDLTAAGTRLAVAGRVFDMVPSSGSLGVVRLTMVVTCLAQLPGLVPLPPEAVVEFVELGQPIRVVLLLGKLAQTVQPCKAMAVLTLDPHHLQVPRVLECVYGTQKV